MRYKGWLARSCVVLEYYSQSNHFNEKKTFYYIRDPFVCQSLNFKLLCKKKKTW